MSGAGYSGVTDVNRGGMKAKGGSSSAILTNVNVFIVGDSGEGSVLLIPCCDEGRIRGQRARRSELLYCDHMRSFCQYETAAAESWQNRLRSSRAFNVDLM